MKIEVWNGEGKDILYLLQKQLQLTQISISLLNSLSPRGDTNEHTEFQSSDYTTIWLLSVGFLSSSSAALTQLYGNKNIKL